MNAVSSSGSSLGDLATGAIVSVAIGDHAVAFASEGRPVVLIDIGDAPDVFAATEAAVSPRWSWWSNRTALNIIKWGVRPANVGISRQHTGCSLVVGGPNPNRSGRASTTSTWPAFRTACRSTCSTQALDARRP